MKQLKDIAHIRLRAKIDHGLAFDMKREFSNYFRMFKDKSEIVDENSFYSPYFARGDVISMSDNYGDRKNAMSAIMQALGYKAMLRNVCNTGKVCASVYISYDFRLAAVNEDYYTDGEFGYMKEIVNKATKGTNLSIIFMASHFNQLVGKPLRRKPEHYHILLGRGKTMNQTELEKAIERFALNLQSDAITVI